MSIAQTQQQDEKYTYTQRPSKEEVLKDYKIYVHSSSDTPELAHCPNVYMGITGTPIFIPFPSNLIHPSLYRRNTPNVLYDLVVRIPPDPSES
ncbi:hypothetical protein K443DRAFT_15287 [Laccaria amethystina LaAM-08-1]|uniref:Uncharacterized protein n=1 Tax=Laccaria amethystina LaAM-08-1 TaxID=1095629 RepID=A0A0C9WLK8_9AGAR|nr:hypothetical protein K443DRAFT_15287 [Laccaria amethystina LaAM-08-1]